MYLNKYSDVLNFKQIVNNRNGIMKKIKYVIRETGESFVTVESALDVYIHRYAERYN